MFGLLITVIAAQNLRIGIRNRNHGPAPTAQPVQAGPGYPPQQWNHPQFNQQQPPPGWGG